MPSPSIARVFFIVEPKDKDIDSVFSFGQPVFLLSADRRVNPFNVKDVLGIIKNELRIKDFDAEYDYVAFTGPMILLSLFLMVIARKNERINVLLFDSSNCQYRKDVVAVA